MSDTLPKIAVAEQLADRIVTLAPARLPAAVRTKCEDLAVDVIGLCLTARNEDYVKAALAGCDDDGPCTAIGHERTLSAARAAFTGPRTVFEGTHGLFHGFANTTQGNYAALTGDFGARWVTETLAFKLYPCGTMTHPYIDCARRLGARGIKARDVKEMICEVGEGTVHRLWEPLADKQ